MVQHTHGKRHGRRALMLAGPVAVLLVPQIAEARLLHAGMQVPSDTTHDAVHLPTGCKASVVLDENGFISASITDPGCLPEGVVMRGVPGSRKDFRLLADPVFDTF